ncbi:MAG TPA: Gfo/Idh/MocA family oxidoreductase [Gemmatimonadales bacterium]|nr:Gfo/Idh/MocA family oxidoreductase [Gemmatimonadales bacterium]
MTTAVTSHASGGNPSADAAPVAVPRLGFLGLGSIGRQRMTALALSGRAQVAALVDPSRANLAAAHQDAPGAAVLDSCDALLQSDVDGIVIATPSGLHASQAIAALEHGKAVFCQKPLARTAAEARAVLAAARAADRLLGLDLSYRFTTAMQRVAQGVRSGEIGSVYAVELVFHNAYGPDKGWCYDPALAGGGCVMDLGVHLVDLALWSLGFPAVTGASARLLATGNPLADHAAQVEDYAVAQLDLAGGIVVRLACSWRLPAGQDAIIGATFYGTGGALGYRNVNGSFYDFAAERHTGATRHSLVEPPDAWPGRALIDWATRLAAGARFDAESEQLVRISEALDSVYHAAGIRRTEA